MIYSTFKRICYYLFAIWAVICPTLILRDQKLKRAGKPKPDHLKHIPFRLREIMRSKEKMKTGASKPRKLQDGEKGFFIKFAVRMQNLVLGLCINNICCLQAAPQGIPTMEVYLSLVSRGGRERVRKHTCGEWRMRQSTSSSSPSTKQSESPSWMQTNKRGLRTRASLRERRSE